MRPHAVTGMVPVELDGHVYFTPNWRRFYLGRPETGEVELYGGRTGKRHTFVEVKHPRVLKALRNLAPFTGRPRADEDTAAQSVPAMVVAAHVCDEPSAYEKRMAKCARERAEKYRRAA